MTNTRAPRRAFTLLEMILAMAMVAMLSGGLYMSLTVAFKARDSAHATIAPVRSATIALDLIRQDLESVPPPGPDPTTATTLTLTGPFYGAPEPSTGRAAGEYGMLDFYTLGRDTALRNDPRPFVEGARRVQLGVRTDVNPPTLVRRVTRNLLAQTQEPPEEEILCRGVRSFVLRYLDGTSWHDEWDSITFGDTLPTAIEITLELDKNPDQPSPGLGVQPQTIRLTRIFPLACAKPLDVSQIGGLP